MTDLTALEQQAIDYARRGDFGADALRVNSELTRLAPASPGAWTRLARCCLELRQLDEASAALDKALELNPQNTIARNMQAEVARRRAGPAAIAPKAARRPRVASRATGASRARSVPRDAVAAPGFGHAEFAALDRLSPHAAVEALGAGVEALLVALNDRPFAHKVVEARNRAGHAGNWLFRRNTIRAGRAGHVYAFHHGGEREPQINVGFFASTEWQRNAARAGIGFRLADERTLAYFEQFQRLVSTRWRQLLTAWMGSNGGFVQLADGPVETSLLPADAIDRLLAIRNAADVGWVFCGRWLFLDRPGDAEILADGGSLVRWMEQAFTDLLPLWMDIYRR